MIASVSNDLLVTNTLYKGYGVTHNNTLLILLTLFLIASLQATTIVLIRNGDGVYIGADSRIVDENGESLGNECKVMKINNYYFTF